MAQSLCSYPPSIQVHENFSIRAYFVKLFWEQLHEKLNKNKDVAQGWRLRQWKNKEKAVDVKCVRNYTNKKELLERKTLCSDNLDIWYLASYANHFLYISGVSIRNTILIPFLLFNWYFGHDSFSSLRTKEFLYFIRSEVCAVPWLSSDNDNPTECKKKYKQLLQAKKKILPVAAVSCKRKTWRGAPHLKLSLSLSPQDGQAYFSLHRSISLWYPLNSR